MKTIQELEERLAVLEGIVKSRTLEGAGACPVCHSRLRAGKTLVRCLQDNGACGLLVLSDKQPNPTAHFWRTTFKGDSFLPLAPTYEIAYSRYFIAGRDVSESDYMERLKDYI